MKFSRNLCLTTLLLLALSACASQQHTQLNSDLSQASSTKSERYVATVNNMAHNSGVEVIWVNKPDDHKDH